jgi:lipopolysaccharide biosynthesis glycosyltransferase
LFTASEPLLACPDGFAYGDRVRALLSKEADSEHAERYGSRPNDSFNAGVLSIGDALLGDDVYESLLKLLDHATWKSLGPSKFTDQLVLNVHFQGRYAPLHACFNYMIFLEEYQKCLDHVSLLDARLVHFAGEIKPWNCYDPEQLISSAPQFIKFIDVWRELLDEARNGTEPGHNLVQMKERYQRQKNWIRKHNEEGIEPLGRLY